MTRISLKFLSRRALALASVSLLASAFLVAQQPPPRAPQAPTPLMAPGQLDTLVAPIALYPDNLLSQVMVAATYPLEVVEAGQWLQQHPELQGQALVEAARQQNWDPSIQALVVFPDVVARLNSDIRWTTDLGNAFLAQQADVMNAVQRMRARARASGRLQSGPQETVTTEQQGNQQAIEIQPANPEMVYVPYYDPGYIWGPPVYGYYPAWDYAGFGFGFGPGIYLGGFFAGLGWGGWGWGPNWFGCSIWLNPFFFNHWGFGWHGGWGGVGGRALWAHDAAHRLGVPYSTRGLTGRYGATSTAHAAAGLRAGAQAYSGRPNVGSAGGWNHFSGSSSYGAARSAPQSSYRSSPYSNSYRGSYSGAQSHYSTPSYRGGNYSSHGSTPSYGGRSSGGSHSSSSSSHSSGGGFHSGGGGSHGGGGGHGGGHR